MSKIDNTQKLQAITLNVLFWLITADSTSDYKSFVWMHFLDLKS